MDPLDSMPDALQAGLTWSVKFSLSDYKASDGWSATVYFVGSAGAFNSACTADGDDHVMTIIPATTALKAAGDYDWSVRVSKSPEKYEARSGTVQVLADIGAQTATDTRSSNKIILDAIRAVIEGTATKNQAEYEIKGRRLQHYPLAELVKFETIYAARVANEKRAERRKNGEAANQRMVPRFQ